VGWRFINLSDLSIAKKYVFQNNEQTADAINNDILNIEVIKREFGGDFIMIPGDTLVGGSWDTDKFRNEFDSSLSYADTILQAGKKCFSGMLSSFRAGGYWKLVVAYGDGDAGDSPWLVDSNKSLLQPVYRYIFGKQFNFNNKQDEFLFDAPTLNTNSRPFGTIYNETSFAYQYENVLFVTVDIWYQEDPSEAINGDDTVKGAVEGEHLLWLESVLREAKKNSRDNQTCVCPSTFAYTMAYQASVHECNINGWRIQ